MLFFLFQHNIRLEKWQSISVIGEGRDGAVAVLKAVTIVLLRVKQTLPETTIRLGRTAKDQDLQLLR